MAQYSSMAAVSATTKERYAETLKVAFGDRTDLYDRVPFAEPHERIGKLYIQPVMVTDEQGITAAAAAATAPVAVNAAVAFETKEAQITGVQYIAEGRVDYESAFRMQKDGDRAVASIMDPKMKRLHASLTRRIEMDLLRGEVGITRIGTRISASGINPQVFAIPAAYWANFTGLENAACDVHEGSTGAPVAKLNTNADVVITKVDIANKRLTLSGTIADLDAITSSAAGEDFLFFKGFLAAGSVGLRAAISNTGTYRNIDGAAYSVWQGQTVSAGNARLQMSHLFKAADGPASRGQSGKMCWYLNPRAWTNVMTDLAALRKFDGSYKQGKAVNGFQNVVLYSQGGELELVAHPLMWESEAFGFDPEECKRLGSVDITQTVPGDDRDIFFHVDGFAGYAFRLFTQQALLYTRPSSGCLINQIVTA